ncbi:hypothetical protein [Ekhidna sp.]|jgi:hypothetical protein|uniref:hypothetical protein n=1 Tax=Ekhidna sp. TaxID=2608089 RepID=UPI0032EB3342
MGKYPVYAIVALVFIGVIKLLQITAFDAEQYTKNKKASFSKDIFKPAKKDAAFNSSQEDEETAPPVLGRTEGDSLESDVGTMEQADEPTEQADFDQSDSSFDSQPSDSESDFANATTTARSYSGLDELKNIYLAPKIANLPPGQLREDVVIRYYRHDQDGDKVYSLKELGYYIHEKEATETEGLGSNVMYYGANVAVEDIQIVAYMLLSSGLPLKSIEPSSFSWKANAIEIGTDPDILDDDNLTESDIRNFSK